MTTALLLLAVALAAGLGALLLATRVARDIRLGVAMAVGVAVLFVGTSRSAPTTVQDASLVAAGALVIGVALVSPRRASGVATPLLLLGAFFAVMVAVTLTQVPEARLLVLRISLIGLAFGFAASRLRVRDIGVVLDGLVLLAVGEALLGAVEFFVTGTPIPWGRRIADDGTFFDDSNKLLGGETIRAQGTTEHPIPYSVVVGVGLVALGARWTRHAAALRIVIVGVLGLGLVLSGTRSTLLAIGVGLAYLVFSSDAASRALRVTAVVLGGVVGAIAFFPTLVGAVGTLMASGSYENRAGALESVPRLLGQSLRKVLLGNGVGSELGLYADGLLPQTGFLNLDNQLVTSLATTGLLGVGLLIAVFVVAFVRAPRAGRALIIVMATMLFSFDYLAWNNMTALMALVLCLPRVRLAEPAGEERTPFGQRPADDFRLERTVR